jgi:hypothetical protein
MCDACLSRRAIDFAMSLSQRRALALQSGIASSRARAIWPWP